VKKALLALGLASIFVVTVTVAGKMSDVFDEPPPVAVVETTTAAESAASEGDESEKRDRKSRGADATTRWVRAANEACADANREARALLREHGPPESLDRLAELGEQAFAVQRRLLDRLGALPRPRSERAEIRRLLVLHRRGSRFLQKALAALGEGRYSPVLRWADTGTSMLMEASDVALTLGATRCGGDASGAGLGSLGVALPN
jgi:hypothetical protein